VCSLNFHRVALLSGLWETVGMANRKRELEFTSMEPGQAMTARCMACRRVFRAIPRIMEKADDIVLRIREQFDAHDCNEDASQAAARIVREATKN
jgi:hypothetical protein